MSIDEKNVYNLLIVDDESHIVDSMAESIPWNNLGINKVYRAYSGDEALGILKLYKVDIIITDVKMPGMLGTELIEKVHYIWKRIKCILLSGYSDFEYVRQALRAGAVNYLTKPASDEEISEVILEAVNELNEEYNEINSYNKIINIVKENLPFIKSKFLSDLLVDSNFHVNLTPQKLMPFELEFFHDDSIAIMIIRVEDKFKSEYNEISLLEYGISNLAEEILGDKFKLWYCKDIYDYSVYLVKVKKEKNIVNCSIKETNERLQDSALYLKNCINTYLKSSVSIVISNWGQFPYGVYSLYKETLSNFRRMVGSDKGLFLTTSYNMHDEITTLQTLYEPPLLINLMEVGRWDSIKDKINLIFSELNKAQFNNSENLLEVYTHILNSISYIIHRNGQSLEKILGTEYEKIFNRYYFYNASELYEWTMLIIEKIKEDMEIEKKNSRAILIKKVNEYIELHVSKDISLQTIADHVFLHPVYLSKLYKEQTGENLSNYICRYKMGKATYMLNNTIMKIYEISTSLGYGNPQYFAKIFKGSYGVTPQQYRSFGK